MMRLFFYRLCEKYVFRDFHPFVLFYFFVDPLCGSAGVADISTALGLDRERRRTAAYGDCGHVHARHDAAIAVLRNVDGHGSQQVPALTRATF